MNDVKENDRPLLCTEGILTEWLERAGIPCDTASRIIIDLKVGCIAKVYIERFGTKAFIKVEPPDCRGASVEIASIPE